MVNQASWGTMGSFLRRLLNIKLAFSDMALIDTLERPLW